MTALADLIEDALRHNDLTVQALAKASDVSASTLRRYLNGTGPFYSQARTVERLARALGCSTDTVNSAIRSTWRQ